MRAAGARHLFMPSCVEWGNSGEVFPGMSEQAIEFLQEWIDEKVQAPTHPALVGIHARSLARECAARAAEAGIPLEDIQEEVGDIEELIESRLEGAAEAGREAGPAALASAQNKEP